MSAMIPYDDDAARCDAAEADDIAKAARISQRINTMTAAELTEVIEDFVRARGAEDAWQTHLEAWCAEDIDGADSRGGL